jgi:hypothetical protein
VAIRLVDRRGQIGRIAAELAGAASLFQGTHTRPAARTGNILTQLQGVTAAFVGGFTLSANRTGTIATTLAGVTAQLQGTFAPAGGIINVSNVTQLMNAVTTANNAGGGREIVLADGTYLLPDALYINAPNITLRSASSIRENVIIHGDAISGSAAVPFNLRVAGSNFVAQNLTLGGRCRYSAVQIVGENAANAGRLSNVVIRDSFEHLLKSSTNNVVGATGWTIEDCLFYFTAGLAPAQYNGGIDVHRGTNWIVRRNTFRDIASPATAACQHAASFWNGCVNTLIERNRFLDCDKAIGDGINAVGNPGNDGTTIRNNQITHTANGDAFADVGIIIENSTNSTVVNNTIYLANSYPNAIEYRFTTTGAVIRNNLTNKAIVSRDGGTATTSNNVTNAQASYFVNPAAGNLDLASSVAGVVDAGATIASVTVDYGGTSRPQGSGYDIGSDEYSSNVLDLPLVQSTDPIFTYVGNFSIPATIKQDNGVGAGGLAMSADGSSMYVTSFFGSVAKMSVPPAGTGSSSLQIGWTSTPGSGGPNQNKLAALEYGGQVYCSKYSTYTEQSQSGWIQRGTTSLTSFTGLSATSGQNARLFSQAFMPIQAAYQSTLGGPMAALGSRVSIISNSCCGYNFVVFDPASVGGNVPVIPLLLYTYSNPLEPGDSGFAGWASYPKNANGGTDLFSSTNAAIAGAMIVPGSRTLLFITSHGYGVANNGCRNGSSVHNDPNRMQCVAFDLRDLVAVKNGTMQPHAVRPYAWWPWNYGGVHWNNCVGAVPMEAGSGVYDPTVRTGTNPAPYGRWYMCTDMFGNNMHTWTVNPKT